MHNFVAKADGTGGTIACALFALAAEILQSEVDGLVHCHWKIRGDNGCLKSGTDKWIEYNISDTAHFTDPRLKEDGRNRNQIIPRMVCPARISEPANLIG